MKKRIILFVILLVAVSSITKAQTTEKIRTLEIETDPIAYFFNGYSLHIIPQIGHWRFDAAIFGIRQPEFFHGNKGFRLYTRGIDFKTNYVFKGIEGFYTGVGMGYVQSSAEHTLTGLQDKGRSVSAGVNAGYRFFFFKDKLGRPTGLYITPWIGISYNFKLDKVEFPDVQFNEGNLTFFPTVHIGYRF